MSKKPTHTGILYVSATVFTINQWSITMKRKLKSLLVILLLMPVGIVCGQSFTKGQSPTVSVREHVERDLLDSLILFEELKSVHFKLKVAYEYRGGEIEELRMQIVNLRMYQTVREKEYESKIAQIKKKARRQRWIGRFEGALFGAGVGTFF